MNVLVRIKNEHSETAHRIGEVDEHVWAKELWWVPVWIGGKLHHVALRDLERVG